MGEFLRTDIGNGERLLARHGRDLHYVPAWKTWLIWDGRRWARDERLEVQRRAKETVRSIWNEVKEATDDDTRRDLVRHALQSESDSRIRAMLARAAAEADVAVCPDQLDADPWLLTVENGVIDLRTGELRPHDRRLLMSKLVSIRYDPTVTTCERWERFLDRVLAGNAALIGFLQRAIGYSLTGLITEQSLLFLHGTGANGKSTFLEVVRHLLGEYAMQADFATFLERKNEGPRNDVARLFGARVVTSSEIGEGKRLNESLVKTLTGIDTVSARFLYAEAFEFKPTFKLWLAANHKPVIRGTDDAIWRRVKLVPFDVQIPEAERDPDLLTTLTAELPGILSWAVAGCLLWQRDRLQPPREVRVATEQYRKDSDLLGAFLEEWCVLDPAGIVPAADLYAAYKHWAAEGGEYQMSSNLFGRRLTERGIRSEKGADGLMSRVGVRLLRQLPMPPPGANGRTPVVPRADAPPRERADQEGLFV